MKMCITAAFFEEPFAGALSGSLSPLWGCNLALVRQAFIESSVVKLDYGKVSTTDLSSFDIPLWHTELQEMI